MMDEPLLAHFAVRDLPPRLAEVARPFGELAHQVVQSLPRHPERTVALRKLLEGMDAALRAARYYTSPEKEMGNSLPQIILAVLLALAVIGNFLPGRHRPSPNPWRDAFGQIILIGLLIWGGFFRAWGL